MFWNCIWARVKICSMLAILGGNPPWAIKIGSLNKQGRLANLIWNAVRPWKTFLFPDPQKVLLMFFMVEMVFRTLSIHPNYQVAKLHLQMLQCEHSDITHTAQNFCHKTYICAQSTCHKYCKTRIFKEEWILYFKDNLSHRVTYHTSNQILCTNKAMYLCFVPQATAAD